MVTTLEEEGYSAGRIADKLRAGNTGGLLLLAAMLLGLIFANTPLEGLYFGVREIGRAHV